MNEKFRLGASGTIGTLILPGEPLIRISKRLGRTVQLTIDTCDRIIEGIKNKTLDLGLIESPIFDDDLVYREWMEDELVVCSNMPLESTLDTDTLSRCKLLCRNTYSPTRIFINDFFEEIGFSYDTFYALTEIDNSSAAIQGLKWAKPDQEHPTVAIVSQLAIESELQKKMLYQARIEDRPMMRKFYLIYDRNEASLKAYTEDIIRYLQAWKESEEA
jgi:DNA-binding transcriptional LysR family regulator